MDPATDSVTFHDSVRSRIDCQANGGLTVPSAIQADGPEFFARPRPRLVSSQLQNGRQAGVGIWGDGEKLASQFRQSLKLGWLVVETRDFL
jgi:hypothetical protein